MKEIDPPKIPEWGATTVILAFLVSVLVAWFCLVAWWSFYPYTPIVVECPIKVLTPVVRAGDYLVYKIKYDKKMNITGKLSRKLVNSYKIDLTETPATSPLGPDEDSVPVQVPRFADAGEYYLWWSCEYKVNPIRTITIQAQSELFEVVR